jgi:hypothetical protein
MSTLLSIIQTSTLNNARLLAHLAFVIWRFPRLQIQRLYQRLAPSSSVILSFVIFGFVNAPCPKAFVSPDNLRICDRCRLGAQLRLVLWADRTHGLCLGSGALLSRPLFMPGDRVLLRFPVRPSRRRVLVNATDEVRISEVMFRTNDGSPVVFADRDRPLGVRGLECDGRNDESQVCARTRKTLKSKSISDQRKTAQERHLVS